MLGAFPAVRGARSPTLSGVCLALKVWDFFATAVVVAGIEAVVAVADPRSGIPDLTGLSFAYGLPSSTDSEALPARIRVCFLGAVAVDGAAMEPLSLVEEVEGAVVDLAFVLVLVALCAFDFIADEAVE